MRTSATWVLRVLWFLLPLTFQPAVDDALSGAGEAITQTMTIGAWLLWALGMVAVAIPIPVALTTIRILSPVVLVLAAWTMAADASGNSALAVIHACVLIAAAMNHLIGDRFVDGASYGDERRMTLRPPTQLMLTAVPLAWLATTAGAIAGPLLLADRRWIVGGLAMLLGAAVVPIGARALHSLSLRWIVFVPTGFVLHDHVTTTEPVLFRKTAIERLGPAIAGSPARDLSSRAAGLLLECELTDPAPLGLRETSRGAKHVAEMTDIRRFLFAPTRPGALLDEAEGRGLPVG